MKLLVLFACLGVAFAGDHLIINGIEANKGDYPPLVSLQRYNRHFCGGTLLDRRTVLTAAHCFYRSSLTGVTATAGITNLTQTSDPDRQTVSVVNAIIHPSYVSSFHYIYGDDICILKLDRDITPSQYVGYAHLAAQGEAKPQDQTDCEVVGWGAIDPPGNYAHTMKMIGHVKSRTMAYCARYFSNTKDNEKNVCAGGERSTNACRGDSGGPLFCKGKQIGVVSYGRVPCGQSGVPTVYTRVATYRDWVEQYTE